MKTYHKTATEKYLKQVRHPGRYVGMEWNIPDKDWENQELRSVIAFPDLYEVGMSHLGLRILYKAVNDQPGFGMERAMCPAPDLENLLRKDGEPVFTLETSSSIRDFDIIGFSLQYELCITNVLNMLDISGIPLRSCDRDFSYPLIIAGGPCVYNPQPFAAFFDVFVIGEAEESLLELMECYKKHKAGDSRENRTQFLLELAGKDGFYIPALYNITPGSGSVVPIGNIDNRGNNAPSTIKKRYVADLDNAVFPTEPLVPHTEIVHDRGVLELFRGCLRGCRFCQAGMIYRPRRDKDPKTLLKQAEAIIESSGYDELGLLSLSTMDYTGIRELSRELNRSFADKGVSLSVPSSRVDAFSMEVAEELQKVRKGSLTMAIEAGSQRLRDIINKNISRDDIIEAAKTAYDKGYRSIKFYIMIGLPFETDGDIEAIKELLSDVKSATGKGMNITVSVGTFVPKPQTPFQWCGQDSGESIVAKQRNLKDWAKTQKGIRVNYHSFPGSYLEAMIARGDHRVADIIEEAFRLGARLDGWTEYFSFEIWQKAMEKTGLSGDDFACKWYETDDVLPWEHISCGVTKKYMQEEYERAKSAATTPHCFEAECGGCGIGCRRKGQRP